MIFIPVKDTVSKIKVKTTSSSNRFITKTVLGGKIKCA
jgi:hypothetical protein